MVFHWVTCFPFSNFENDGVSNEEYDDDFQNPNYILWRRIGSTKNHCVLLCCAFLGIGCDAYICTGKRLDGRDHCWVLTKERNGGCIHMWDVENKSVVCMKGRCGLRDSVVGNDKRGKLMALESVDIVDNVGGGGGQLLNTITELSINQSPLEFVMNIATNSVKKLVADYPSISSHHHETLAELLINEWQSKELDTSNIEKDVEGDGSLNLSKSIITELSRDVKRSLSISPNFNEFKKNEVCPYLSIEVVFNNKALYGNVQNHHPNCIAYDFDVPQNWEPALPYFGDMLYTQELLTPVDSMVFIDLPMAAADADALEVTMCNLLSERITIRRAALGFQSYFEEDEEILSAGREFLELLEYRNHLDVSELFQLSCSDDVAAKLSKTLSDSTNGRVESSNTLILEELLKDKQKEIFLSRGLTFTGFPIHLNSPTTEKFAEYFFDSNQVEKYLSVESDNLKFVVTIRVFPLPAGVSSVWVFFGVETSG